MVVGFVNSGMMTLNQAVWIIMGANIGTTITGQLIALDVGELAPLMAFIGMDMMGSAMKPLAEMEGFVNLLTKFENPFLGILAGTVFVRYEAY